MVSPETKNIPKLGTNINTSFLSFGALLAPTNSSHKKKITAPNECIAMKDVAINQGPCKTQELKHSFLFHLGLHLHPKRGSQKREYK